MPLPELNTTGIDIGNTLRTIAALKAAQRQEEEFGLRKEQIPQENALRALQMQNVQSEIEARGTPEEQAVTRENTNYVAMVKRNREDAALKSDDLKDTARALLLAKEHPNAREVYRLIKADKTKRFETSGGKIGIHPAFLPDEDYFQKKTVDEKTGEEVVQWDNDKFNKFADQGLLAVNMAQNPIEGKTYTSTVKTPPGGINDTLGNLITPDISQYVKVETTIKNGKPTMLGVGVTEDIAAKEKRAQETLEETKKRNAEDARYHRTMENREYNKEEVDSRKRYTTAIRDYNREIGQLTSQYNASMRSGIPMTTDDWNLQLKTIEDKYAPAFAERPEGAKWGEEPKQAKRNLKPMTDDIQKQIRAKAKTKEEAIKMAEDMGYDPYK
jgi:hypothetical protein